ncbi:hypothetical protein Dsin_010074 [Dipteronia sinensis]|uniref:Uncharacterized protein n=1 Tax=Dipteronia sinensis TaxID=43782 RepID=A0AAE0AT33_9ROSI|nr:hypothetical protein Dsin_010074 [Dipteronia sinensis]
MFRVVDSFKGFVFKFFVFVIGSILTYMFRFKEDNVLDKNHQSGCEFGQKVDDFEIHDTEHVNKIDGETENSVVVESVLASSTSKRQFSSERHISGFIEQPKTFTFSVQELYLVLSDPAPCDKKILDTGEAFDPEKTEDSADNFIEEKTKTEDSVDNFLEEKTEDSADNFIEEKTEDSVDHFLEEKTEDSADNFIEEKTEDSVDNFLEEKTEDSADNLIEEKTVDSVESDLKKKEKALTENESSVFTEFKFLQNYDYLLKDLSPPLDFKIDMIAASTDAFSTSNDNFGGPETESHFSISEDKEENFESNLDFRDQTSDSDDEFIVLETQSQNSTVMNQEKLFTRDSEEEFVLKETEEEAKLEKSTILDDEILSREDLNEAEDLVDEKFEESNMEEGEFFSDSDSDSDDFEFSLEHEELLEQLKMELKNARTGGLPTIEEEESESPKKVEQLKPLKIDQKLERKDHILEIHKFYKSYLEKIRKLDILNFQTMHAIGLLQLKETGQVIKTQKSSSVAAMKSLLLPQNLRLFKPRKHEVNPILKFTEELQKEFELVYVGQMCLSWEILHWQYRKALELQEYDYQEYRQYNQVAEEFQLFQVLLQRFIENEPFQSIPRVQNYVNNRCAHCNFLHVPVIKDDSMKDKMERRRDENDTITSPMLTEIIDESMRVFWEFLRADKDGTNDVNSRNPELQDSIDLELLTDIRTDFQKKDKRFKELLRSGSCIVKKFQNQHTEDRVRLNHAMFFAQVELRLVSRVLNMSKLTAEQLLWCHEKLANINLSNRKLLLEPSFLLFPC